MASLNRTTGSLRGFNTALAVLLFAVVTGCVLLNDWFDEPRGFSHRIHVDVGLDCADCHGPTEGSEPVHAALDTCLMCHDEAMDAGKPQYLQAEHVMTSMPLPAERARGDVVFAHETHATAGIACNECHTGIESANVVEASLVKWNMGSCVDCHEGSTKPGMAANDCATCHTELNTETAPASHMQNWQRMHGLVARAETGLSIDECATCHTEQTCTSCHLSEPPASHNNTWRLRTHGVAASIDRDNCSVCHQPDSCVRCHSEVTPLNHRGTWGGSTSSHCMSCHEPVSSQNCSVCHKGTPSHMLATPKPGDHSPAMNCRLCHGNGQPLPHPDPGTNCNACHH